MTQPDTCPGPIIWFEAHAQTELMREGIAS